MLNVFMAAAQLTKFPRTTEQLLHGVIAGVIYQAVFALWQFAHGAAQPGGAFGAQNLLGLMTNFALVPSLAMLLVQRRSYWAYAGVAGGLLLDFLTASRATLALAGVGLIAMFVFSCAKNMTGRKGAIFGAMLFVSAAVGALALHSMGERRSAESIESSNAEREAFKRAAWMVIADYPFGTGANQYVLVANLGGYSARAGVNWNAPSRATNVHNSYLLVLAETGPLGVLSLAFLLLFPVVRGVRAAYRFRRDARSEVLLGFAIAMLVFAFHLFFEWAWVLYLTQYMFAMYAGITLATAKQMQADRIAARKPDEPRTARVGPVSAAPAAQAFDA
jgi:O-antigen ligase